MAGFLLRLSMLGTVLVSSRCFSSGAFVRNVRARLSVVKYNRRCAPAITLAEDRFAVVGGAMLRRHYLPASYHHRSSRATAFTRWLSSSSSDTSSSSSSSSSSLELVELKQLVAEALDLLDRNLETAPSVEKIESILHDLEQESADPSFWDDSNSQRNQYVTSQLSQQSRLLARLRQWQQYRDDAEAALEMLQETNQIMSEEERALFVEECQTAAQKLLEDSQRYELESLLSGPYDDHPARLVLTAGAGGTEANDWVADLKRMYERHCEKIGFSCKTEDAQAGEQVGYKSVELLVDGPNAYGWLRGEKGAHRLVRLSPFNANNKRQTTFAGVDVAPILDDEDVADISIPDSELEISTMRSGGKGGQNVNKLETCVRIKHLPSGLQVKCAQERSQALNKDLALKRLKGQLLAIAREQRVAEVQAIRGDAVEAAWGAQIRNYVLHPYKMVKDQRTNWETSDTQGFLDGDLEDCIGELLRHRAKEEQESAEEEARS
jgi:peptide chain release factor 2